MVGGGILRQLEARKAAGEALELITRTSADLDLTDQVAVRDFMQTEKPDGLFWPLPKPMRRASPVCCSWDRPVSTPRLADQPMAEDALLTGTLEPTNEPYAIAKIAGSSCAKAITGNTAPTIVRSCRRNLYGPGDNFHPKTRMFARFDPPLSSGRTGWRRRGWLSGGRAADARIPACDDMAAASLFVMDRDGDTYERETPAHA
ncbi:GDP-L-fucose synthase [Nymphon striatum]|nr:GDP-L-fucose synthase [Nymphon striatum]